MIEPKHKDTLFYVCPCVLVLISQIRKFINVSKLKFKKNLTGSSYRELDFVDKVFAFRYFVLIGY